MWYKRVNKLYVCDVLQCSCFYMHLVECIFHGLPFDCGTSRQVIRLKICGSFHTINERLQLVIRQFHGKLMEGSVDIPWKIHGRFHGFSMEPSLYFPGFPCNMLRDSMDGWIAVTWKFHGKPMEGFLGIPWKMHGRFIDVPWNVSGASHAFSMEFVRWFSI